MSKNSLGSSDIFMIINNNEVYNLNELASALGMDVETLQSQLKESPHIFQEHTFGVFEADECREFNQKYDTWMAEPKNANYMVFVGEALFSTSEVVSIPSINSLLLIIEKDYLESLINDELEVYSEFVADNMINSGALLQLIQRVDPKKSYMPYLVMGIQSLAMSIMSNILRELSPDKKQELDAMIDNLLKL